MTHASLVQAVRDRLGEPLPGASAQALLAPRPRRGASIGPVPLANTRAAAGLVMLVPVAGTTHLVLTERSSRVRHAGQLSLPGGEVEPGESHADAAVREAREEIRLTDDPLEILGTLTPVDVAVSGFRLHPVVATFERRPVLHASDGEVARILEIPIASLLANAGFEERPMRRGALEILAPGFAVEGGFIWGATAMVLSELLVMLGWRGPTTERS